MDLSERIKNILGESFKEDMSAEDVLKVLNEKQIGDLSNNEYVSANKYRSDLEEANKKAKEAKKKLEEKLTDEEKVLQSAKEKDELIKKQQKELQKIKAEKVFATAGFKEEEYSKIANNISPETAELLVSLISTREKELQDAITEYKLKGFHSPEGGKGGVQEKKFSEMTLDEKMKLKKENPEKYAILKKE